MSNSHIEFTPDRFVITISHIHACLIPVKERGRPTLRQKNHEDNIKQSYHRTRTYCKIDETTGHSKLESDTEADRLSRYIIRSHQAGMRFFSPESYPGKIYNDSFKINASMKTHDNKNSPSKDNVNLYTEYQSNSNVVYSLNKKPKLISNTTMRQIVHIVLNAETHIWLFLLCTCQTCLVLFKLVCWRESYDCLSHSLENFSSLHLCSQLILFSEPIEAPLRNKIPCLIIRYTKKPVIKVTKKYNHICLR